MLRRPLTVLTVTAEDIADYEDRAAERLRQRDLLLQARARREAIAAHHHHAAAAAYTNSTSPGAASVVRLMPPSHSSLRNRL